MSPPAQKLKWDDLDPVDTPAAEANAAAARNRVTAAVKEDKAATRAGTQAGMGYKLSWDDLTPVEGQPSRVTTSPRRPLSWNQGGDTSPIRHAPRTAVSPGATANGDEGLAQPSAGFHPKKIAPTNTFASEPNAGQIVMGQRPVVEMSAAKPEPVITPLFQPRYHNQPRRAPRSQSNLPMRSVTIGPGDPAYGTPRDIQYAPDEPGTIPTSQLVPASEARKRQGRRAYREELKRANQSGFLPVQAANAVTGLAKVGANAVSAAGRFLDIDALKDAGDETREKAEDYRAAQGDESAFGNIVHGAAQLAPGVVAPGGFAGFGAFEASQAYGEGEHPAEAIIKRGIPAAATAKLGGELASRFQRATAGPVEAYAERAAGNLAAPVVVRAATGGGLEVTPEDVGFALAFGVPGGAEQAARHTEATRPAPTASQAPSRPGVVRRAESAFAVRGGQSPVFAAPNAEEQPITSVEATGETVPPRARFGAARNDYEALRAAQEQADFPRVPSLVKSASPLRAESPDRTAPASPAPSQTAQRRNFETGLEDVNAPKATPITPRAETRPADTPDGRGRATVPQAPAVDVGEGKVTPAYAVGDHLKSPTGKTFRVEAVSGDQTHVRAVNRNGKPTGRTIPLRPDDVAQFERAEVKPVTVRAVSGPRTVNPETHSLTDAIAILGFDGTTQDGKDLAAYVQKRPGTINNTRLVNGEKRGIDNYLIPALQDLRYDVADTNDLLDKVTSQKPVYSHHYYEAQGEREIAAHLAAEHQAWLDDKPDSQGHSESDILFRAGKSPEFVSLLNRLHDPDATAEDEARFYEEATQRQKLPDDLTTQLIETATARRNEQGRDQHDVQDVAQSATQPGESSQRPPQRGAVRDAAAQEGDVGAKIDRFVDETNLLPRQVAEDALRQRGIIDDSLIDYVEQKAARAYASDKQFAANLRKPTAREFFRQFVDHWLDGEIGRRQKQGLPSAEGQGDVNDTQVRPSTSEALQVRGNGYDRGQGIGGDIQTSASQLSRVSAILESLRGQSKETGQSLTSLVEDRINQQPLPSMEAQGLSESDATLLRQMATRAPARAPVAEKQEPLLDTVPTVESLQAQRATDQARQSEGLQNAPLFEGRSDEPRHKDIYDYMPVEEKTGDINFSQYMAGASAKHGEQDYHYQWRNERTGEQGRFVVLTTKDSVVDVRGDVPDEALEMLRRSLSPVFGEQQKLLGAGRQAEGAANAPLFEGGKAEQSEEPWQMTRDEFDSDHLIHGTNIAEGGDFDYVEPRIGDFTRELYSGSGDGSFEEMGGKELAYFRPTSHVESIKQYATGVAIYPKKGKPYILVTERPSDALIAKEDGLYDFDGGLYSRDVPIGVEAGDIISEQGASVLHKIPLKEYIDSGAQSPHEYFVRKALSEGRSVPPEVLRDYPDLITHHSQSQTRDTDGTFTIDKPKVEVFHKQLLESGRSVDQYLSQPELFGDELTPGEREHLRELGEPARQAIAEHGQFARFLFHASERGKGDAFLDDPAVKTSLGLPKSANMTAVHNRLRAELGMETNRKVSPEALYGWAADKNLPHGAVEKIKRAEDAALDQAKRIEQRRKTEGGFLRFGGKPATPEQEVLFDDVNQTVPDKTEAKSITDFIIKARRAMLLSSVKTIGKLGAAATGRIGITPIEEAAGAALGRIPGISRIAAKAPREGGFSGKAEGAALSATFSRQTLADMKATAKTGASSIDTQYGGKTPDTSPEAIEFFGRLHGALKTPAKRGEFYRSLEKRTAFALQEARRNGITDAEEYIQRPDVQAAISAKAYEDAQRAIFMNDNGMTEAYKMLRNYAESRGVLGKSASKAMQFFLPVVKVPTNYVIESSSYGIGAAKALGQVISAKGIENLTPDQADYVMRNLKKQSIGAAMMAIGYFGASAVGGYYQEGDKRAKGEPEAGGFQVFGVDVPKFLLHTPALEALQIGATLRRVSDKQESLTAGTVAAGKGLIDEIPFFNEPARLAKAAKDSTSAAKFAGETVRSMIVPPDVQNVARMTDTEKGERVQRHPQGFVDTIKVGIPGLRQQVEGSVPVERTPDESAIHSAYRAANPLPPMTPLQKTKFDAKKEIETAIQRGDANTSEIIKRNVDAGLINDDEVFDIAAAAHKPKQEVTRAEFKKLNLERMLDLFPKLSKGKRDECKEDLEDKWADSAMKLTPHERAVLGPRVGQAVSAQ